MILLLQINKQNVTVEIHFLSPNHKFKKFSHSDKKKCYTLFTSTLSSTENFIFQNKHSKFRELISNFAQKHT